MATMQQMNGEKLVVQVGDGGSPETFEHKCMINTDRGIQFSSDTSDNLAVDCANPSNPAWVEREKDGLSATINGAGKVHTPNLQFFFDWWKGGDPKTVRVKADVGASAGGGYWQGKFHLTEFEITGTRKERSDFTCSLASTGELTWIPAT